jgi:hypothetical protein
LRLLPALNQLDAGGGPCGEGLVRTAVVGTQQPLVPVRTYHVPQIRTQTGTQIRGVTLYAGLCV